MQKITKYVAVVFTATILFGSVSDIIMTSTGNNNVSASFLFFKSKKEKKKIAKKKSDQKKQLKDLNNWFNNNLDNQETEAYAKDGEDYHTTDGYIKASVIKGFKNDNGDLTVQIDNNRMKAEGLSQKDVANYAFAVITTESAKNLDKFDNMDDSNILKDYKHPQFYSELK